MKFPQKAETKNQQTKQKPCMRLNSHPISYRRTLVSKDFLLFSNKGPILVWTYLDSIVNKVQ